MSDLSAARSELKKHKKKLHEIPNDILIELIRQDRNIKGVISILQIDSAENKIQALVKEHNSDFWYSFENGEFMLFSCTYEIKRPQN